MRPGSDMPGRITRLPGGVALNIAMTLARFGMASELLSVVGRDAEGDELIVRCQALGVGTGHVWRSDDLPTDRYMAIEGAGGLVAALADAHSLEAAGARILDPLIDGRLARPDTPWTGAVALDGNLTHSLLSEIAHGSLLARADLRVAPASPGKAERLAPLLGQTRATVYLNKEEAGLICGTRFAAARDAAMDLASRGARRVLVTDGGAAACFLADGHAPICAAPPAVRVTQVTGAGDTFMAAHIAAELSGAAPSEALETALSAAACHVSGGVAP